MATEHIADDDLLDLASARRVLGDEPALEAHLADCPACSGLLSSLMEAPEDGEAASVPDRAGTQLGPYRLEVRIGAGAMGEVYRGWDARLARPVAVKVLSRRVAGSPDRIRRLAAEARAAAVIAHANVVTIHDIGTDGDTPYVVSELIDGESVRSVIDRGPIARATALDLAVQLVRGVAAAHAQGVIHRDLKPSNLIATADGTLKILDFGLAKLGGGEREAGEDGDATEPGTLLGTAGYLAPEQARGEPADARSDLFAVGAIVYELVTGTRAFAGATFAERLSAVLRDTPAAIDGDPIGPIVARCLDKDPRKRFQTAADLLWAIEHAGTADAPAAADRRAAAAPRPKAMVSRRAFLAGAAATGVGGVVLGRLLAPSASPRAPFRPEYRQLTFRQGRVATARFTPDGGSVIYAAQWDDQPIAVYSTRLGGGGVRALDLPPAEVLAVSAKGELALALDPRYADGFDHRGQLAVAPVEGGAPRALGADVQHADFTPDGAELAIVRRVGGKFRLELPIGRVLLEADWLSCARVSRDGSAVACVVHDTTGDDRGDVVIVPRTGGPARTIAAGWSSIDGLAWAPSGSALWVSASRDGGNNSLRLIGLDGRERREVPSAGRVCVHDAARDGHLAVTNVAGRTRMLVRAPGGRDDVDLALGDVTIAGDITSDGRSLLFAEIGDVDTASGVYLRPTDGGAAIRLGPGFGFDIADDGRGVLVIDGEYGSLAVYPIAGGATRRIAVPGLDGWRYPRWAAGDAIVLSGFARGRPSRLWRVDAGGATPITDEGVAGSCAVSPDGRTAALITGETLVTVDVQTGGARELARGFSDDMVCGWWTGGGEVLVRGLTAPIGVRRISVATAAIAPVATIDPPRQGRRAVFTVTVSADGGAYAYSYNAHASRLYSMTADDA